jgi:hypothetical protein
MTIEEGAAGEGPARVGDLVRLLWTGGWDSTFRLLDLILVKQSPVQPYYFIDTRRRSFGTEILAMNAIKRRLAKAHPDRLDLLRPSIFRDVVDIPADDEIAESYRRVCAQTHIGIQYEWGARFARAEGLTALELSLIGRGHMFGILKPLLHQVRTGDDLSYEIDRAQKGTDLYRLFENYRFPLIMTTKQEMLVKAKQQGIEEFMMMTVFCHTPRPDSRPCGLCIPCGIAIDNGLGWRLPRASRVRNRLQRLYRKGRGVVERFPRLFPAAQRIARALRREKKRTFPIP